MARRRSTARVDLDFDPRLGATGRYVDRDTGRIVATDREAAALETQISQAQDRMQSVSTQLAEGNINLAQWQEDMRAEMKVIHVNGAVLAKGGRDQMTQSDWGAVGQLTRSQYEFLENFAIDIETGKQRLRNLAGEVNGQFLRRADLYAQAGAGTYSQMQRRQARQNSDVTHERRVLDRRAQHCACCPAQAAQGWQPIGDNDLLPIGACDCATNCRCHFRFGRLNDEGFVVGIAGDEPVEEGPTRPADLRKFRGTAPDGSITISDEAREWLLLGIDERRKKFTDEFNTLELFPDEKAAYKIQVAKQLSEATGIDEELASDFVRQWAETSNDSNYGSLFAQKEAAEKFGIEMSEWQQGKWEEVQAERERALTPRLNVAAPTLAPRHRSVYETPRGELLPPGVGMPEEYATNDEATRATIDAMYERTQAELQESGIETVTLYRGVSAGTIPEPDLVPGDVVSLDGNALESWSLNPRTALAFSGRFGTVLKMEVPAERIFATSKTGYGALDETEFVIIGGKDMGEAIKMDNVLY